MADESTLVRIQKELLRNSVIQTACLEHILRQQVLILAKLKGLPDEVGADLAEAALLKAESDADSEDGILIRMGLSAYPPSTRDLPPQA